MDVGGCGWMWVGVGGCGWVWVDRSVGVYVQNAQMAFANRHPHETRNAQRGIEYQRRAAAIQIRRCAPVHYQLSIALFALVLPPLASPLLSSRVTTHTSANAIFCTYRIACTAQASSVNARCMLFCISKVWSIYASGSIDACDCAMHTTPRPKAGPKAGRELHAQASQASHHATHARATRQPLSFPISKLAHSLPL